MADGLSGVDLDRLRVILLGLQTTVHSIAQESLEEYTQYQLAVDNCTRAHELLGDYAGGRTRPRCFVG